MTPGKQNGPPPQRARSDDSISHHAAECPQDSRARELGEELHRRRTAAFRGCGAAWEHFRRARLTCETVAETLREIIREAA